MPTKQDQIRKRNIRSHAIEFGIKVIDCKNGSFYWQRLICPVIGRAWDYWQRLFLLNLIGANHLTKGHAMNPNYTIRFAEVDDAFIITQHRRKMFTDMGEQNYIESTDVDSV